MIGGFQPLRGSLVLITYLRYRVCAPPYFLVYNPGRAPVLTEFMFIKTPYKPNQILTYDNIDTKGILPSILVGSYQRAFLYQRGIRTYAFNKLTCLYIDAKLEHDR